MLLLYKVILTFLFFYSSQQIINYKISDFSIFFLFTVQGGFLDILIGYNTSHTWQISIFFVVKFSLGKINIKYFYNIHESYKLLVIKFVLTACNQAFFKMSQILFLILCKYYFT